MLRWNISKIDLLVIISYLLIPIIFFFVIIINKGLMVQTDGIGYIASTQFFKDSILQGEFPLWNRFNSSGTVFAADIQNKVFYPITWLFLVFPAKLGFKLYFLFHLSLAAIFMYYYLTTIKLSKKVAYFGGIAFMFSNILIIRYEHINILNCIIWVPLLLLLFEKLIEKQEKKYTFLVGVIMGVQFLGGFPQTALYTDIFVFLYYITLSIHKKIKYKNIFKQTITFILVYIGIIAIQLLPLIEVMLFSKRNIISYDYFTSYAFDLRMLINMIFPAFWGEWGRNLNKSMEFPTDMYVGIGILILLIYAWRYNYKDKRVQIFTLAMIGSFLFACAPQVPFLGKLLYALPIISSFRVLSRIMFVFGIAAIIIASITLDKIICEKEYKKYLVISIFVFLVIIGMSLGTMSIAESPIFNIEYEDYYGIGSSIYKGSIILSGLNVILALILMISKKTSMSLQKFVVFAFTLVYILDVYFINIDKTSNIYRISGIINQSEIAMDSEVTRFLDSQEDIDQYRVLLDNISDIDTKHSIRGLKDNYNIFNKRMSIQGYLTFDNPNYLEINDIWNSRYINTYSAPISVLSMLSNKYIIRGKDQEILKNSDIIGRKLLYEASSCDNMVIKNKELGLVDIKIPLNKNKIIEVNIDFDIDAIPSDFFTIDLYGGKEYDLAEANKELKDKIKLGNNKMTFNLSTGNVDIPKDAICRIVMYTQEKDINFKINHIEINELETSENNDIVSIYENEEVIIYENRNAKPLISIPSKVINTDGIDKDIQYLRSQNNLEEISYVKDFKDMDLTNVNAQVTIEKIRNNYVKATITSDEETFVNMAQCYYPGWKVYVDDEKAKLYKVNNLIQGVAVPKGTHSVTFRYIPITLYVGASISVLTIIGILISMKKHTKVRKQF